MKGAKFGGGTLASNTTGEWGLKKGSACCRLEGGSKVQADKKLWSKVNGHFSNLGVAEGGGWASQGPRERGAPVKLRDLSKA